MARDLMFPSQLYLAFRSVLCSREIYLLVGSIWLLRSLAYSHNIIHSTSHSFCLHPYFISKCLFWGFQTSLILLFCFFSLSSRSVSSKQWEESKSNITNFFLYANFHFSLAFNPRKIIIISIFTKYQRIFFQTINC